MTERILDDETGYTLLRRLQNNPGLFQRDLAKALGTSPGKTNCGPFFRHIAVHALGSAGTQYERPASDVDLAFLSAHGQNPVGVCDTAQSMATRLGRDVDLVDLRKAPTVMAANVIVSGTQLPRTDKSRCTEFEVHTLSDYARLNEERAGILEGIRKRSRIHA